MKSQKSLQSVSFRAVGETSGDRSINLHACRLSILESIVSINSVHDCTFALNRFSNTASSLIFSICVRRLGFSIPYRKFVFVCKVNSEPVGRDRDSILPARAGMRILGHLKKVSWFHCCYR